MDEGHPDRQTTGIPTTGEAGEMIDSYHHDHHDHIPAGEEHHGPAVALSSTSSSSSAYPQSSVSPSTVQQPPVSMADASEVPGGCLPLKTGGLAAVLPLTSHEQEDGQDDFESSGEASRGGEWTGVGTGRRQHSNNPQTSLTLSPCPQPASSEIDEGERDEVSSHPSTSYMDQNDVDRTNRDPLASESEENHATTSAPSRQENSVTSPHSPTVPRLNQLLLSDTTHHDNSTTHGETPSHSQRESIGGIPPPPSSNVSISHETAGVGPVGGSSGPILHSSPSSPVSSQHSTSGSSCNNTPGRNSDSSFFLSSTAEPSSPPQTSSSKTGQSTTSDFVVPLSPRPPSPQPGGCSYPPLSGRGTGKAGSGGGGRSYEGRGGGGPGGGLWRSEGLSPAGGGAGGKGGGVGVANSLSSLLQRDSTAWGMSSSASLSSLSLLVGGGGGGTGSAGGVGGGSGTQGVSPTVGGGNRPQHPLVHASTPSWVKYGEEHYPEEAVPVEYQWVEDDGTCCCYVTDFLLYNKKGERLLQIETLDHDDSGDVALYGKLVHVALVHPPEALEARGHPTVYQVYPHLQQKRKQQQQGGLRGRKPQPHLNKEGLGAKEDTPSSSSLHNSQTSSSAHTPEHTGTGGGYESPEPSAAGTPSEGGRGGDSGASLPGGSAGSALGGKKVLRKRGGMLHHPIITPKIPRAFRTFPVRVDLSEWIIDYGQTPSHTPYLWLISSMNRFYRLEKPAGRYVPIVQSLKYKFEVASRVIKQLSVDPSCSYQFLVDRLTADSRLKAAGATRNSSESGATGGDENRGGSGGGRADGGVGGGLRKKRRTTTGGGAGCDENDMEDDEKEDGEEEVDFPVSSGQGSIMSPQGGKAIVAGVSPSQGGRETSSLPNTPKLSTAAAAFSSSSGVAGQEDDEDMLERSPQLGPSDSTSSRGEGGIGSGQQLLSGCLSPSQEGTSSSGPSSSPACASDMGNLVLPAGLCSSSLALDPSSLFTASKFISALAVKKNKNCHLLSLSDPDGTGVRTLPDGSISPESPWGAAFAVEGCTEESLIEVFPFLESQVAAFEASTGTTGLVGSPFMNALRARVLKWAGKLEDQSGIDEVPPVQQSMTPEILGGRTPEGGLFTHQPPEVVAKLDELAAFAAHGLHPGMSPATYGGAGAGPDGGPSSQLDSTPGFIDPNGFYGSPAGGVSGGGGRSRRRGGRVPAKAGKAGSAFSLYGDGHREGRSHARNAKNASGDQSEVGDEGDEQSVGAGRDQDGPSGSIEGGGKRSGASGVKREPDDGGRKKEGEGAAGTGGLGGGEGGGDEEGSSGSSTRKTKKEEDLKWTMDVKEGEKEEDNIDKDDEDDLLMALPDWGAPGDPADVKDELDLDPEDPAYARIPLSGSAFSPYDFPELLELQDFWRVFSELLRLPIFPMDILEAAFLSSSSLLISRELVQRAFKKKRSKASGNGRMDGTLCFAAAAAALAPCPQPFRFVLPEEFQQYGLSRYHHGRDSGEIANIKAGVALRDAAAKALLAGCDSATAAAFVKEKSETGGTKISEAKKEKEDDHPMTGENSERKKVVSSDTKSEGIILQNGVPVGGENGSADEEKLAAGGQRKSTTGGLEGDESGERGADIVKRHNEGESNLFSSTEESDAVQPVSSTLGSNNDLASVRHLKGESDEPTASPVSGSDLPSVKLEETGDDETATAAGTSAAPVLDSSASSGVPCQGESDSTERVRDAVKPQASPITSEEPTSSPASFFAQKQNTLQYPFLRSAAFPVFLSDAVYLRLLQLAFLHVHEALSRHAKASNSTAEKGGADGAGGGMETRGHQGPLPLGVSAASTSVSLLASSAASGTSALGTAAAGVQGFGCGGLPGIPVDIPAAATWLGTGFFGSGSQALSLGGGLESRDISSRETAGLANSSIADNQSCGSRSGTGGDGVLNQQKGINGAVSSYEGSSLQSNPTPVFGVESTHRTNTDANGSGSLSFLEGGRTMIPQLQGYKTQGSGEYRGTASKAGGSSSSSCGGSHMKQLLWRQPGAFQQLRRLVPQEETLTEIHPTGAADTMPAGGLDSLKERRGEQHKYDDGTQGGGQGRDMPVDGSRDAGRGVGTSSRYMSNEGEGYDTDDDEEEPEVLRLLNGVPPDLRLMDFLTWPLVLQRMLFDCLYTPRRVAVKKPRKITQFTGGKPACGAQLTAEGEGKPDGTEQDREEEQEPKKSPTSVTEEEEGGGEGRAEKEEESLGEEGEGNDHTREHSKEESASTEPKKEGEHNALRSEEQGAKDQQDSEVSTERYEVPVKNDHLRAFPLGHCSDPVPPDLHAVSGVDSSPICEVSEGEEVPSSAPSHTAGLPTTTSSVVEDASGEIDSSEKGEQLAGTEQTSCTEMTESSPVLSCQSVVKQGNEERQEGEVNREEETPSQTEDIREEKDEDNGSGRLSDEGGPQEEKEPQGRDTPQGEGDMEDNESVSSFPLNASDRSATRKRRREKESGGGEETGDDEEKEDTGAVKARKATAPSFATKKRVKRVAGDGAGASEDEEDNSHRERGGGGEEEDEEEGIEEVERLEWHLDDAKAAQCGMTPTRIEIMALVFNEMRLKSKMDVRRRMQLLQWLIACIADGWMGKFFLDAKVEALFRARANTLRQRMASAAAPSTTMKTQSDIKSERDGDSGLGDGGVSCSPTEDSHPSSRSTGPDGIKTEIIQSDTPVDAPPPTSVSISSPSPQSSPDGPGSSHGQNAAGGDIDLDSSRTESTTNNNHTNSTSAASSTSSSGRGTRRGGSTGGGSVTSKGSGQQSASGEESGSMTNHTTGWSGNPGGQTQGGGSSNSSASSNSRRRRATGSLASSGRGGQPTPQQPTDGIEEEEGDRESKVEGSSFVDGEDDQNLSRGTSLPEGSNGKGGGGDSGGGLAMNSNSTPSSSSAPSTSTGASGMLAGSANSNSKTLRGQKKPVGRVSNWEMELLAQKFPLRGEVLGEDRFLNRYFLVPTALGVPRIFVEAFSQMSQDALLDHAEAFVNGYLQHAVSTVTGPLPSQEDEDKRKEEHSMTLHPSTTTPISSPGSTSFSSQATAESAGLLTQQTNGSAATGNLGGVVGHQGGGGPSQAQTQQQQGVHQSKAATGGIGEIGRRSSRRIALKEEQRQQQEQLDALAALQSGGGGGGTLGKSSDDKKRKRGGALQNGALGRGSGRNSATGGAGGSTLATTTSGSGAGGSLEQQKYKKANAFVRRAVGFPSISLFLQYLEETIRSCRLYVVPPGQPIQQLQHALSPYMLKERALKEKIRRVDQQFQQLVACSPPPVPAPTVVPPTPFASSIWHACRWLLHLEECLLLPLFSCSWGFASIFQKHQYLLRLQEQRSAELSAASSKKPGTRKSSSGTRHSRVYPDSTRGGDEGLKTEEGSSQGTGTEGRHHARHQEEEEVEEKLGKEKSESSRGGRGDEGISPEVAFQIELSKRVWPQDVMHRSLAVLATHANQMAEKGDMGGDDLISGGFDLSGGKGEMKVKKEEDTNWKKKTAGCTTMEGGEGRGAEEMPKNPTGDASYSEHQSSASVTYSEEEEEEARWMEKRLCLIVLTQLLLYIENQLHTHGNVHTAAWHLQQHQEWQKELSALAGGSRVLRHFPLPLPPTGRGVPLSPTHGSREEGRGGLHENSSHNNSKNGMVDEENNEGEGSRSTNGGTSSRSSPADIGGGGRKTKGSAEGQGEEDSRRRRRSVPSDGEGLSGGRSGRRGDSSRGGLLGNGEEHQKGEKEEGNHDEEDKNGDLQQEGDSNDDEDTRETMEGHGVENNSVESRRELKHKDEGMEGEEKEEDDWRGDDNDDKEDVKPRLDWCSRDGEEEDEKDRMIVDEEASIPETTKQEDESSPIVKNEQQDNSPTPSPAPSDAPPVTFSAESSSSNSATASVKIEQKDDVQEREVSEVNTCQALHPVILLSPSSPLRRVQALAESIGWNFSAILPVLRRVRAKEARQLWRIQQGELERRSVKISLEGGENHFHASGGLPGSSTISSSPPCSPSSWAEGEQDRVVSWAAVRNRADVLAVWGLYANAWKAFGLDKHKLMDVQLSVDRNLFLSLLAHDEQKAGLPDLGDRLFYFRKGHEQSMISMQQEYVEALDTKSWLDSSSIPLSIPFELGRVEELVVESISYHPGLASPPPPPTPPSASTSLLSALPSGLSDAAHEHLIDLPDQLFSFSIVDDPSFLGLVPLDSSTSQGGRTAMASGGGTMTGHRKSMQQFSQACKKENGTVSSTPTNSILCGSTTQSSAGLSAEGLLSVGMTPVGCQKLPGFENDEVVAPSPATTTEEGGGGGHSTSLSVLDSSPPGGGGSSSQTGAGGGKNALTVRTPSSSVYDRFKFANTNLGLLSCSAGGLSLSSLQGGGVGGGGGGTGAIGDLSGWMSGEGSLTPLVSNGEGLPVGLLGRPELEIFTSADPLVVAAHTAGRAKAQLLRQTQQDDGAENGDGDRGTPLMNMETAPYYRMVCRVIRREHETTADALSERIKSIVTAAASEDKPHTRTSSRLLNYQSRIGVTRSTLSSYLRNRQAYSSQKGGRGGQQIEPSGDEEEESSSTSTTTTTTTSVTHHLGMSSSAAFMNSSGGSSEVRFDHVVGPQGERQVVLCVPVRADDIEFVVRKDRVLQALNLGWNVGMKFRMLFHTAGAPCHNDASGSTGTSPSTGKDSTGNTGGGGATSTGECHGNSSASTSSSTSSGGNTGGANSKSSSGSTGGGGSHTTRYTGTVRKVDLLHPDFWENVLVEWEDKKHGGCSSNSSTNSSSSSSHSSGNGSSTSNNGKNSGGSSSQLQKGELDGSMEGVSLWELEPLKRLKRPGGAD